MKFGFTGTSVGMSSKQHDFIKVLLNELIGSHISDDPKNMFVEFHMGDCIGSDTQFYEIVYMRGLRICHPPDNPTKRSFLKYDFEYPVKPYLKRNADIATRGTSGLLAAPYEDEEMLRSGTWATIRYARKLNRKIYIVHRDGRLVTENVKK
jgi:hypothetical protein